MTSDKRDIAVASVTKFGTAIANSGALLYQGRRAGDRSEQDHKESHERMHRSSVRRGSDSVLHGLHPDLNDPIQNELLPKRCSLNHDAAQVSHMDPGVFCHRDRKSRPDRGHDR